MQKPQHIKEWNYLRKDQKLTLSILLSYKKYSPILNGLICTFDMERPSNEASYPELVFAYTYIFHMWSGVTYVNGEHLET